MDEAVEHPSHYGGKDNPYEVIKIIEALELGFHLGNVLKYIGRPAKGKYLEDLKKARWYLDRKIELEEAEDSEGHRGLEPNGNLVPSPPNLDKYPIVRFKIKQQQSATWSDYQMYVNENWTIEKVCRIAATNFNLNAHGGYGIALNPNAGGFVNQDFTVASVLSNWPQPAYNYYLRERD